MSRTALSHFSRVDPVIHGAAREVGPLPEIRPQKPKHYVANLCMEVINQQLSKQAADVIEDRFLSLFPWRRISTKHLLEMEDEELRSTGMSWAKVKAIKDLAEQAEGGAVRLSALHTLENEEVISELRRIKGIGQWTAEMFLIFTLGREDVFSYGDAGLQRGLAHLYELSEPEQGKIEAITTPWSPHRSYASRVLWRVADGV